MEITITLPLYISKKLAPTTRSTFLYLECSSRKTSFAATQPQTSLAVTQPQTSPAVAQPQTSLAVTQPQTTLDETQPHSYSETTPTSTSVYKYRGRRFEPRQHQYVVSLSKTFYPHCFSRLSCEMSTRWGQLREGCPVQ